MNGWLKWLPWLRKPVFVPGPDPALMFKPINRAPLQELNECDCGRSHPDGWVCNSPHRDQM